MIEPKNGEECIYALEKIVSNLNLPSAARKEMLSEIIHIFKINFSDSFFILKEDFNKEGKELYDKHKLYNQFEKALQRDSNINLLCPEGICFLYNGLKPIIDKYEPKTQLL